MKLAVSLSLVAILGCANSKKAFHRHEKRGNLFYKNSDTVFTFDVRNQMYYGEFFNLLANAAPSKGSKTQFITINFKLSKDSLLQFRTYFPRRRTTKDPVDSTRFIATIGITNRTLDGNQRYSFQVESRDQEVLPLEQIKERVESLRNNKRFSNFLVVLVSDSLDMKSEVVPFLGVVQKFGVQKNSFSAYVEN